MNEPTGGVSTAARNAGLGTTARQLIHAAGQAIERRDPAATDRALVSLLAIAPDHPEVLRLLGVGYMLVGRHADAVATLQRARAVRPADPLILNNLGSALRGNGEGEQSIAMLREACARAPKLAAAWYNLGKSLKALAHIEEACEAFARAISLQENHLAARVGYANTLRALGRIDEALVQYRDVIRRKPDYADAWLGLTNIKTHQLSAAETNQLQTCYAQLDLAEEDRALIGFALANALEHQDRHTEAFAVLTRANALRQRSVPWDAAAFSCFIDAIAAAFAGEGHGAPGAQGGEVIFLVSLPRSGSTLTEQIISTHSEVEGAGELPDLEVVIEDESKRRNAPFPQWAREADGADWQRLGQDYLQRTRRWRNHHERFTDKALANWQYLGAAALMLPGARFVDCRRDPVETCLSCYRQWFGHGQGFSYQLESLAAYWHDYVRLMNQWDNRWPDRIHRLTYEDLLRDPENQTRRLLEACGLSWQPACLDFHLNPRAVRTASAAQVRQPLRQNTARAAHFGALLDPLREALRYS